MRILVLLFIGFGLLLCLSVIFAHLGLLTIGVGALLCLAGEKRPRQLGVTTPGYNRRVAIACSIAIAVILLGALVHRMTSPAPIAPAVTRQAPHAPESPPPPHRAKHLKASRGQSSAELSTQ